MKYSGFLQPNILIMVISSLKCTTKLTQMIRRAESGVEENQGLLFGPKRPTVVYSFSNCLLPYPRVVHFVNQRIFLQADLLGNVSKLAKF